MAHLLDNEAQLSGEDTGDEDADLSAHTSDEDANASDPGSDRDFSHRALDEAFRKEADQRDLMSSSEDDSQSDEGDEGETDEKEPEHIESAGLAAVSSKDLRPESEAVGMDIESDSESVRAPRRKGRLLQLDSDDELQPTQEVSGKRPRSPPYQEDYPEPQEKRARLDDWAPFTPQDAPFDDLLDGLVDPPPDCAKEDFEHFCLL